MSSRRRFRPVPRRYAASVLFSILCASAISRTSRGKCVSSPTQSVNAERKPCTVNLRPRSCRRHSSIAKFDNGLPVAPLWNTGAPECPAGVAGVCYIDNFVDAALLALRHDRAPGHAFNISDGLSVTWKEFTDGLAQGLGVPPSPLQRAVRRGERHRILRRGRLQVPAQDHTSPNLASALPAGGARTRHKPGLQRPQGAGGPRLETPCGLHVRPHGDDRLAARRGRSLDDFDKGSVGARQHERIPTSENMTENSRHR
jgi:hypothetical protein